MITSGGSVQTTYPHNQHCSVHRECGLKPGFSRTSTVDNVASLGFGRYCGSIWTCSIRHIVVRSFERRGRTASICWSTGRRDDNPVEVQCSSSCFCQCGRTCPSQDIGESWSTPQRLLLSQGVFPKNGYPLVQVRGQRSLARGMPDRNQI